MKSFLAGTLFIFVDLLGILGTAALASWAADRDVPKFVKGLIGALCGFPTEAVRLGIVWVLVQLLYGQLPDHAGLVGWFASFRFVNIPILIGVGFTVGSFAGETTIPCPACGKPVPLNAADIRGPRQQGISIAPPGAAPRAHQQDCPHCKVVIAIDPKTMAVVGHESANKT
jgi:hypothetical protein